MKRKYDKKDLPALLRKALQAGKIKGRDIETCPHCYAKRCRRGKVNRELRSRE